MNLSAEAFSPDVQRDLFRSMLRIRMVEEAIAERYSEQKMRCPTHLCIGQEAVCVGSCSQLNADDFVVGTHRSHGHYLARGGSLNAMIAEIYGKVTGCSAGKGGSMHLIDRSVNFMGSTAIVGNTIPVGVGLGLSIALKGSGQVSCVFLGDGAIEEGVFYESVNFAVVRKLPVLFLCENNLYSVYSPLRVRQPPGRAIHQMVAGMGLPSQACDGNDVVDVTGTVADLLQSIRQDGGPRFVEFSTYRWREHCGPNYDNDLGYRRSEEFEEWRRRDPVTVLESKLSKSGAVDSDDLSRIRSDLKNEIDAAFKFAETSAFPGGDELYDHVYSGHS